jgi:hypothetical protein
VLARGSHPPSFSLSPFSSTLLDDQVKTAEREVSHAFYRL